MDDVVSIDKEFGENDHDGFFFIRRSATLIA